MTANLRKRVWFGSETTVFPQSQQRHYPESFVIAVAEPGRALDSHSHKGFCHAFGRGAARSTVPAEAFQVHGRRGLTALRTLALVAIGTTAHFQGLARSDVAGGTCTLVSIIQSLHEPGRSPAVVSPPHSRPPQVRNTGAVRVRSRTAQIVYYFQEIMREHGHPFSDLLEDSFRLLAITLQSTRLCSPKRSSPAGRYPQSTCTRRRR